jgi:hypothetical protein
LNGFLSGFGQASDQVSVINPIGFGEGNFIGASPQEYQINFKTAGNNAGGEIRIITPLDGDLDPRTFSLGQIRIGDVDITVPAGRFAFDGQFDFTKKLGFFVKVSAGIDAISKTTTWLIQAIDPVTGLVINKPDLGLVPPNGGGFVKYRVQAKNGAVSGSQIVSSARLFLKNGNPLESNQAINTLDIAAPVSDLQVEALINNGYRLNWSAVDEVGGSGVKDYNVFVSEGNGDYRLLLNNTKLTTTFFQGKTGQNYEFLVRAADIAGNRFPSGEATRTGESDKLGMRI